MVLTLGCKLGYWTFAITKKTGLMPCVNTSEVTLKLFQVNYLRLNIPFQCWIVSWWIGPNIFFREIKVMRIKHSNLEYCKASKQDFMNLYYIKSFQFKELFWQFNNLLVGSDNIFYIKVQDNDYEQLVLPRWRKWLIYLELLSIWVILGTRGWEGHGVNQKKILLSTNEWLHKGVCRQNLQVRQRQEMNHTCPSTTKMHCISNTNGTGRNWFSTLRHINRRIPVFIINSRSLYQIQPSLSNR